MKQIILLVEIFFDNVEKCMTDLESEDKFVRDMGAAGLLLLFSMFVLFLPLLAIL